MKALVVNPKQKDSARLIDLPEPPLSDGALLVEMLAIGVCGTDREIVSGAYGWAPKDSPTLTIGHESLGRVLEAPAGGSFSVGDLVVGIVRRPDPVPCNNCAVGEWDMCTNELYTERGIKERNGFCSERYRLEPEFAIKVESRLGELGVLLEPASVMAKAWAHSLLIGQRALFKPRKALIVGAGPVGLLGALIAKLNDLEVHVVDRVTDGPKPQIVADLGAHYYPSLDAVRQTLKGFDIIMECTGVANMVADVAALLNPGGILCLAGISSGERQITIDAGTLERSIVLGNEVIFGSVNAGRSHYVDAANYLARADAKWLAKLVSRRIPLSRWQEALETRPEDIKNIICKESL